MMLFLPSMDLMACWMRERKESKWSQMGFNKLMNARSFEEKCNASLDHNVVISVDQIDIWTLGMDRNS